MFFEQVGCGTGSSAADDARSGGRGQSEVIGVILTVAIVVVLGALVGQYVFGLDIIQAGEQNVGPQISFEKEVDGNSLTIRHQSGGAAEIDALTVVGSDYGEFDDSIWNGIDGDGEWTASESITLTGLSDGETVRIIWESPTTGDSSVLVKYEFTSS